MANSNEFGVGLMHEFALTAAKKGWEPKNIGDLSKDEAKMELFLGVMMGTHEVKPIEHAINCGAAPYIWDNSITVEFHDKGGIMKLEKRADGLYQNGRKIILHLSKKQINRKTMEGYSLREELTGKPVLNANVLDYLLAHPELIPEDWKKDKNNNTRYIFFWGTIYRRSDGNLYVRFLYWNVSGWRWGDRWLVSNFVSSHLSALLA